MEKVKLPNLESKIPLSVSIYCRDVLLRACMSGHRVLCCKDEVVGADPGEVRKGREWEIQYLPLVSQQNHWFPSLFKKISEKEDWEREK